MAILQEIEQDVQGFDKKIESSALGSILDNLQISQYQYPQRSAIRELVSNAVDSVKEKFIALDILSGKSKVEDHFIVRDDPMYQDSNFDPSYYDPSYLSADNNVVIKYTVGSASEKDSLSIYDPGVGLGGRRLSGYFRLGYSTKRNTKTLLGKFGIGAKSPLSTANFYTVHSYYNGKLFSFNVYAHKIQPITPRFNLSTGKENPHVLLEDYDKPVYYLPSSKKNGVEIVLETKKHHYNAYLTAIKNQLMYFDNVEFVIVHPNGKIEVVDIKATTVYEDSRIILSDNSQYTKPHLVINKVNYGLIDFQELELEEKGGNIGIKVSPEEVDVNQSRESVIWNDRTRQTVLKAFEEVKETASRLVEESLVGETDFIRWLRKCSTISYNQKDNSVLGRLASVISGTEIKPKFNGKYPFSSALFKAISFKLVHMHEERTAKGKKIKVLRDSVSLYSSDFATRPVYISMGDEAVQPRKEKYLLTLHPEGFIHIHIHEEEKSKLLVWQREELQSYHDKGSGKSFSEEKFQIYLEVRQLLLNSSKDQYALFKDVQVPDDFKSSNLDEEEEILEVATNEPVAYTPEEMRKLHNMILVHAYRQDKLGWRVEPGWEHLTRDQINIEVSNITKVFPQEIYWGTRSDEDEKLLKLATYMTRNNSCWNYQIPLSVTKSDTKGEESRKRYTSVVCLMISEKNKQFLSNHPHIQQFYLQIRGKTITMAYAFIQWYTASQIQKHLSTLKFLQGMKHISPYHHKMYVTLKDYSERYYRSLGNSDMVKAVLEHAESVKILQDFVRKNPDDTEGIGKLSQELFNPNNNPAAVEIDNGHVYDPVIIDMLTELLEFAEPLTDLLNHTELTSSDGRNFSKEFTLAVQDYMAYKNIPCKN